MRNGWSFSCPCAPVPLMLYAHFIVTGLARRVNDRAVDYLRPVYVVDRQPDSHRLARLMAFYLRDVDRLLFGPGGYPRGFE